MDKTITTFEQAELSLTRVKQEIDNLKGSGIPQPSDTIPLISGEASCWKIIIIFSRRSYPPSTSEYHW